MSLLPRSFLPFWLEGSGHAESPVRRQGRTLGFFLAICGAAAFVASVGALARRCKTSLHLFYAVLAVARWRIWRTGAFRSVPFTMVGSIIVLFLQSIWSTLFYGLQSPLLALVDLLIICLLASILWLTFMPLDAIAARLWLAYLLWLFLLVPVNAAIWWINA